MRTLRDAGLTANPKKCKIGWQETTYLGYQLGRGLIRPLVGKVEAIQNYPAPTTKKKVRQFLGLAGYYRRFVPQFATLAAPLTALLTKDRPQRVTWTAECEAAFQNLKAALCSEPVLFSPDFSRPFIVQTDASDYGLGAVLSQEVDGEEHPVLYISRKLFPRERSYAVIEKEALAIKWAIEALRYYLLGDSFILFTDHAPLQWLHQMRDTNSRIMRWYLSLQPYVFTVKHRAGRDNANADALSRIEKEQKPSPGNRELDLRGEECRGVEWPPSEPEAEETLWEPFWGQPSSAPSPDRKSKGGARTIRRLPGSSVRGQPPREPEAWLELLPGG
uniref:Reverse transcriptase RNase H-like domain-containing protein n=1 Tax=Pelodiscus sinensis TaxID=13735 RepID=K7EYM9_PELSI